MSKKEGHHHSKSQVIAKLRTVKHERKQGHLSLSKTLDSLVGSFSFYSMDFQLTAPSIKIRR